MRDFMLKKVNSRFDTIAQSISLVLFLSAVLRDGLLIGLLWMFGSLVLFAIILEGYRAWTTRDE